MVAINLIFIKLWDMYVIHICIQAQGENYYFQDMSKQPHKRTKIHIMRFLQFFTQPERVLNVKSILAISV